MKETKIYFILILAIALVLSVWLTPESATFKDEFQITLIGQLLGMLFIIALFLERALDVFLTTWRAGHSEELDSKIKEHEQRIKDLESKAPTKKNEAVDKLKQALEQLKQEKLKYRTKTRNIAMWSALFCGILISAVGIRTLQSFVLLSENVSDFQLGLFHFLDVLLTGGLIAGGSDSVHKLTELYRNFVEQTTEKTKKGGQA